MKRISFWLVLFMVVAATELLAVVMDWSSIQLAAKPMIVLTLMAYYLSAVTTRSIYFILALLFCWAGDLFLMFQYSVAYFFILGLGSFLIGHVLYIVSYRQFRVADKTRELMPTQKFRYSLPIVMAGTGLNVVLFPNLGSLQIPVVVYAVVLMIMVVTALLRFGRTNAQSFWMIFLGALFFMVSDSCLAINKFYSPIENANLLVMTTYISAQYLIVAGAVSHHRNP